jgi:cysteine desulfurase/selenocysteine lyase
MGFEHAKKVIYVNNAATSFPKPDCVIQEVNRLLKAVPFDPGRGLGGDIDVLNLCRQNLALLIRARETNRIILTPGATYSLNLAIYGCCWNEQKPVHVITTVLEHNSMLRPLEHLRRQGHIEVTYLPYEDALSPDRYPKFIKPNTRIIALTACSNVNGVMPDLTSIAEICRERQLSLIVDAAQAAGTVTIDVGELPKKSLIAFAGHKGLMGPAGTGALYVGEGFDFENFTPLIQGGTGFQSESLTQPRQLPIYYEAGTMNLPGFAGLAAGLSFVLEKGVEHIAAHKHRLIKLLLENLKGVPNFICYPPLNDDYSGGVLCCNLINWMPNDVSDILRDSFGIICRTGLHCAPMIHMAMGISRGSIRISVGFFNTEKDMLEVASAIRILALEKLS